MSDTQLPSIVVALGEILEAASASEWVIFIVVPAIIVGGATYLKKEARPTPGLKAEDKVFGFDLGITAAITLLISGFVLNARSSVTPIAKQHYVIGLFVTLLLFGFVLKIGAHYMHKYGWTDEKPGGVMLFIVNLGGFGLLVLAFFLTGGTFK